MLFAELRKPKPAPQKKSKIYLPEVPQSFHADLIDVDICPQRRLFAFFKHFRFRSRLPVEYAPYLLPSYPFFLVQAGKLADSRNNPLPGPSERANRLHQCPVTVILSVNLFAVAAQIHSTLPCRSIIMINYDQRKGQFCTTLLSESHCLN